MENTAKRIAVVDLETTGPNVEIDDKIIQIGAVILEEGKIKERYSMLINPEREIPHHISQLTGIKNDSVINSPTISQVIQLWYQRLKDCVLVAHNLAFDLRILKYVFQEFNFKYDPIAIDSVKVAKILLPQAQGYNLTDLSLHLNLEFQNAHDALADAEITANIMSKLAKKLALMDPQLIEDIRPYVKNLRHKEEYFFDNYQNFIIRQENSEYLNKSDKIEAKKDEYVQAQSFYVLEQWAYHNYLLLDDSVKPLSSSLIQSIIENKGKQSALLVVVPNLDHIGIIADSYLMNHPDIFILKASHHYIHLKNFQVFKNQFKAEKANQQELVTLAASLVWLSETNNGDFQELNHEFHIKEMMEKYLDQPIAGSHYYYQKALENAQKSPIVFVNNSYFVNRILNRWDNWSHRALLVIDLPSFILQIKRTNASVFNFSDLFISTQNNINLLDYIGKNRHKIYSQLEKIAQTIQRVQKKIVKYFRQEENNFDTEYLSQYISQEKLDKLQLVDDLNFLSIQLNLTGNLYVQSDFNVELKELWTRFKKYKESYQNLLNLKDNNYFIVKGRQFNQGIYQLSLEAFPKRIESKFIENIFNFSEILILSNGQYQSSSNFAIANSIDLNSFKYIKFPLMHYQKLTINLPIDYMGDKQDDWQELLSFIKENDLSQDQNIIIICSNQEQCKSIFNQLKTLKDYQILSPVHSGSLNRIRRKIIEKNRNILILTRRQFMQKQWHPSNEDGLIILVNLPFNSPNEAHIAAMLDQNNLESLEGFNHVTLPLMIQNLKMLGVVFQEHYPNNHVFLLDSRVYTSVYADEIDKAVKFFINFSFWQ